MDGENNGKPYEQMDDLGGFPPPFKETPSGVDCWLFLAGIPFGVQTCFFGVEDVKLQSKLR